MNLADGVTPPHSAEAEQSVIGALLLDNQAFDRVADVLRAEQFYSPDHRAIFTTIARLITATKLADVITVFEAGQHDVVYLSQLASGAMSSAGARRYAEIIVDRHLERELLKAGADICDSAVQHGAPVRSKIDAAQSRLAKLGEVRDEQEPRHVDDAVAAYLQHLSDEAEGKTRVMATGLHALDKQLNGGLREGELMVIGARPKMGKTALTLTLQRAFARNFSTLLLSQEMPVNELVARHMAALGSINLADLRRPQHAPADLWSRVTEATEALRGQNILLDDHRALTLLDVRRKVMQAKRRHGLDVVLIDFLQLMAGEGDNRNQELDRISNGLKAMAGEFHVAVVLLSQLNREADKRSGPPVMTDLRDSGAIEGAADIIALLYREYAHPLGDRGDDFKHFAQLEVVQRNGAPGTVPLGFSGEYQRFFDWEDRWPARTGKRVAGYSGGGLG